MTAGEEGAKKDRSAHDPTGGTTPAVMTSLEAAARAVRVHLACTDGRALADSVLTAAIDGLTDEAWLAIRYAVDDDFDAMTIDEGGYPLGCAALKRGMGL